MVGVRRAVPVLAGLVGLAAAAGCASGGPTGAGTATSAGTSTSTIATTPTCSRDVRVGVADGQVSPRPGRVEVTAGQRVCVEVTSDRTDEVHVHGYDRVLPLAPGRPARLELLADQRGLFEVETHESGLLLFQLLVR